MMSLTITVPVAVPSLFHSSSPWLPSLAVKNTELPSVVKLEMPELADPG